MVHAQFYNKHRIEALGDGIFAVAMTLLVIELKLPEHGSISNNIDLINAVVHLIPKFIAWLISFFVLALFWLGHHRLFHYVRHVDGKLLAYSLLQLGFVSLMPFSSALSGEHTLLLFSQIFYSINMVGLAITALMIGRYVYRHPELTLLPLPGMVYEGIRTIGLGDHQHSSDCDCPLYCQCRQYCVHADDAHRHGGAAYGSTRNQTCLGSFVYQFC